MSRPFLEELVVSVESELISALQKVEADHSRSWSLHARNLAHGIEESGVPALLGEVNSSLGTQSRVLAGIQSSVDQQVDLAMRTNSTLMALAAVNVAGFAAVCASIGETNRLLSSIEHMLANPLSTAAAERYRRGIHALSQEWYEPALKELDAAIEQDPFQALSHFARGLTLGALERNDEAFISFKDTITFTGKDPALLPVLAGAAILAAQAAHLVGKDDDARTLLVRAVERVPNCPELLLALARSTGDSRILERALRIAPELSVVALTGNLPDVVSMAETIATDPNGPVASMRPVADWFAHHGLHIPAPPESVPGALAFHRIWKDNYLAHAIRLAEITLRDESETADQVRSRELYIKNGQRQLNGPPEEAPALEKLQKELKYLSWAFVGSLVVLVIIAVINFLNAPQAVIPGILISLFFISLPLGFFAHKKRSDLRARLFDVETRKMDQSQRLASEKLRLRKDKERLAVLRMEADLAHRSLENARRSVPDRVYPLLSVAAPHT